MDNEFEIVRMYQSALQNIGIYTSISIILFIASQIYVHMNKSCQIYALCGSLVFSCLGIITNHYLLLDISFLQTRFTVGILDKYIWLLYTMMIFNMSIIIIISFHIVSQLIS